MRRLALAGVAALSLGACRPYDNYAPLQSQAGLVPAEQFARYGHEQAEMVAIGRSLAKWKMTADSAGFADQTAKAACFARRFPEVETVDADPLGHRLTIRFKSGWRAAAVPVDDGVEPEATPGISPLGPSPCP
ncbi:MAG TPA: hypothetical protein VGP87_16350 [Gemmatimonadales bacterium]|jgi:hypothetical protein|nr:hypothetical protein [Gemmatimonadales bacterium]